ncbi:uncharacterized protein SOCEGT47_032100 [Sorangium cellulosum]|uniref:Uncharacterized protein n=1 Tax=Sorangium cellulosum TaxID=56 RepID=A0A4P2Q0H4_SORCE|nr:uncharacterized protein SOCEGT47_032100 [Sorangium cellulosum]
MPRSGSAAAESALLVERLDLREVADAGELYMKTTVIDVAPRGGLAGGQGRGGGCHCIGGARSSGSMRVPNRFMRQSR